MKNKSPLFMRISFASLTLICFIGCINNAPKTSSMSTGSDSLAIIYTKDKWSIIRPRWINQRNFAVTGKIMNYAMETSYKDFVIQVDYISETKTVLLSKQYTLFTSIKPQKVIDFDQYIDDMAPEDTSFQLSKWKLLHVTGYLDSNPNSAKL